MTIECLGKDKNVLYALDISDPEDTDEDDDLLDSYTFDDDFTIYGMMSTPGYLYISCKDHEQGDVVLLVMDIADPESLSLIEAFDELGDSTGHQPEINIGGNGDYIYATVDTTEAFGSSVTDFFEFKMIDK